jgi:hypothetical protein
LHFKDRPSQRLLTASQAIEQLFWVYRKYNLSGPCRVSIKVRNPERIAVQRERSEMWNSNEPQAARPAVKR